MRSLATGDTFVLDFGRSGATFVIAEIRDRFPALPLDRPFVVANVDSIAAAGEGALRPTVLYLRAPGGAVAEIDSATRLAAGAVLAARSQLYEEVQEAPLIAGVGRGFSLAFWVASVFAMVAAVAAFALTSKSRLRDLAFLRTLGLTRRSAMRVTILEQLPPTLIVAAIGGALGTGMAVLFEPGIDLAAFTGPGLVPGVKVDMAGMAIIIVGLALTVLLAVRISGYFARDDNLGDILRLGDE
jgi:putative ABC transport system permease protein